MLFYLQKHDLQIKNLLSDEGFWSSDVDVVFYLTT